MRCTPEPMQHHCRLATLLCPRATISVLPFFLPLFSIRTISGRPMKQFFFCRLRSLQNTTSQTLTTTTTATRKTNKTLKNHLVDRTSSGFLVDSSKHYFSFVSTSTVFLHCPSIPSLTLALLSIRAGGNSVRCTCEDAGNHFEIDANVILTPESCGRNVTRIH